MLQEVFSKRQHHGRVGIYVAEIGLNHNGDIAIAKSMVEAAAVAGADAVKFQTIVPELLNSVYTTSLLENGKDDKVDVSQIDFFSRFTLTADDYFQLKNLAESLGMVFFSAPFDKKSLALLEDIGVSLYKIASSEVSNIQLIRSIAATGKPAIMSTGISLKDSIKNAVETYKTSGGGEMVLLHCVSNYPVAAENINARRVASLRREFGLHTGFSDHSNGTKAMVLAAAFGARIFEKHFTIDSNYDCPDKAVSASPKEFSAMINEVEESIMMLGDGDIDFGASEEPVAKAACRSLFAGRNISAGSLIAEDDIMALRPGVGISAVSIDSLVGRKVKVAIEKDKLLRLEFFE